MNERLTADKPVAHPVCRLCETPAGNAFLNDRRRDYFQCPACRLIFVSPGQFLSPEHEKAEYDLHENLPDDPGYRRFLGRLFQPMQQRIPAGSRGLDFGSGPGPALSLMFEEVGHEMEIYDKFYARNPRVLDKQYDFITATEVVEHLHQPSQTLDQLWGCLKPVGWFGIMTKLSTGKEAFAKWHYKNDLTHVCFYSRTTFLYLATRWRADVEFIDNDVILFKK